MAVKSTDELIDLSEAPFSEEQREWLQQHLGRLAKGPNPSGRDPLPTPLATGETARDSNGELQST